MTESRSLRLLLCHSTKDSAIARDLFHQLNAEEWLDVWFVEDRLLPSQDWGPEIIKGSRNADVVIVLISKNFDAEDMHRYPSWGFVSNALHEKVSVVPLLLDEHELPEGFKAWHTIEFYPKNKRKLIYQNIIKSLKTYAEKLGISIAKRSPSSVPEKSVQWTPSLWKQIDDADFDKVTEPELPAPRPNHSRQRIKKNIFRGVNHLFLWGASLGTLLILLICGLTINFLVRGGTTNSFTAPIVSRALTLVPLPAPTLGVGSVSISPMDGMRMVYVPAGEFIMGSDDGADDEKPARSVSLDAYWIDQFEVTNEMYKKCVDAGKCNPPDYSSAREWINSELIPFPPLAEPRIVFYADIEFVNYPVSNITWDDASAYCTWAGRRLPTEAEWEKAARGTDGWTYPWGEEIDCTNANVYRFPNDKACAYAPARVGSYESGVSPFGAYDMAGNVMEFVSGPYATGEDSENFPSTGFFNGLRVLKGGSWITGGYAARSANREPWDSLFFGSYEYQFANGFRCATSSVAIAAQAELTPVPTREIVSQVSPVDGMTMVYVPAGEFTMGSDYFEEDEKPAHPVYLDAFWIDQYEVTNGMYAKCVKANACGPPLPDEMTMILTSSEEIALVGPSDTKFFDQLANDPEFADQPVTHMFWDNASAYCTWAGRRLPTEAEWEKAARGFDERTYPWGEQVSCTKANFFSCTGSPLRVGSLAAGQSPYGAYDMAGNAMEWVADWYNSVYYKRSPYENPLGPGAGLYRVFRGGSWNNEENSARSTNRPGNLANVPSQYIGFRCASSEQP